MTELTNAIPESTRATNMEKRRMAIMSHTRKIIAEEGFDALKLRDLAKRVGVTVPTIYNLIGGKPEILSSIITELVERLAQVQSRVENDDIELAFEVQIEKLAELFASDERYYKAAFIAGDRSGLFEQRSKSGIYARSVQLPIDACVEAQRVGLLRGQISATQLGTQIYGSYRLARQDWTHGYFNLKTFRQQALTGVFLCLAADANAEFHERLISRVKALK